MRAEKIPLELTILMPCLNEAETIGHCVAQARAYLDRCGLAGEVLVADNGSTDGSAAIARGLGARVVSAGRMTSPRSCAQESCRSIWRCSTRMARLSSGA
jgi:Glycosyl transferase family 2